MTVKSGRELLGGFKSSCKKDADPFFVCHFSRQDDKFEGDWDGLDDFDAAIILKQLLISFPTLKILFPKP